MADHPAIIQARTAAEIEIARALFREYSRELGLDLCFQGFEEELRSLPGKYAEPRGRLLLAFENNLPAGCGALRPFHDDTAEMKRLYIRRSSRRRGHARRLCAELIEAARAIGYRSIVLDTLRSMNDARSLYASFGFLERTPYYANPLPDVCYLQLDL